MDAIANYTISATTQTAAAEVEKANLTINWTGEAENDFSWVYDGTANRPTTAETLAGVNGETATVTVSTDGGADVGNYTATATVTGKTGFDINNYNIIGLTRNYSITAYTGEIVVTIIGNSSKVTYTGLEQSISGYSVSIDNDLYKEAAFNFNGTAEISKINAGSYSMGLAADDFTNTSSNFENVKFNVTDGELVIEKAKLNATEVTASGEGLTKIYNATTALDGGLTLSWTGVNSETVTVEIAAANGAFNSANVTAANAIDISGVTLTDSNYELVFESGKEAARTVTLTKSAHGVGITAKTLTLTADMFSTTAREYNGSDDFKANTAFNWVTGMLEGTDTLELAYTATLKSKDAAASSTVIIGGFSIESDNYVLANSSETFTKTDKLVTAKEVTLTWSNTALTYTGTEQTPTAEIASGLVTGETLTVTVTPEDSVNMGAYTATASLADSGEFLASNYVIKTGNETQAYSIAAFDGEIVVTITGHNKLDAVYDGTEQSVSGYDVSISNDLYKSGDIRFTGTDTLTRTNAGTYAMGLSEADFVNASKNFTNVKFVVADGSLVINQATIKVTVTDQTISYGDSISTSGVTYSGFVGNDTQSSVIGTEALVSSNDYTPGNNAGTYTLTAGGATDKTGNYTFTYVDGNLTVNKKVLTLTADMFSTTAREYNGSDDFKANTAFDWATGMLEGTDTLELVYTATLGSKDAAASSTVTIGGFSIESANYELGNSTEKFTKTGNLVTAKEVTLTWSNTALTYTGTEQTPTAEIASGLVTGETLTVTVTPNDSVNAGDYTATAVLENKDTFLAGNYVIKTGNETQAYSIAAFDGEIVVTITGHNKLDAVYDGTEQSVSGYDVSISNDLYKSGDITFTGTETLTRTNAGTYAMGLSEADFVNASKNFTNVKFVVTDGQLIIDKAPLTVSGIIAEDKIYDGTNTTKLNANTKWTVTGIISGDDVTVSGTGVFVDEAPGENKDVIVSLTLSGETADNYKLADETVIIHANIKEAVSTVVTTNADIVNPFDGEISLREAVIYAADLGTEIAFADGITAIVLTETLTVDSAVILNTGSSTVTISGSDVTVAGGGSAAVKGAELSVADLNVLSGGTVTVDSKLTAPENGGLTLSGGSVTVNSTGTLNVLGTASVKQGALTNAGTMQITGTLTVDETGGTFTTSAAGSKVIYNGTGNQTIVAADYYELEVAGSGTKSLGGDIGVLGALTIAGTAAVDVNGKKVSYKGGDGQQVNTSVTYAALDLSGGSKKADGDLTADSTVISDGSSLDVNGNFAGGALTNNGALTLSGANNSFTGTAGDVTYDGTDAQNVVVSATYGDLTLTGAGAKSVTGDITADSVSNESEFTVTGNLTVDTLENSGDLSVTENLIVDTLENSGDLTVTGDLTAAASVTNTASGTVSVDGNFAGGALDNSGALTLSGAENSFTGTAGDVTYDGDTAQEIVSGVTYGTLTITGDGAKTADGDVTASTLNNSSELTVTGDLTATAGTVIGADGVLTVNGNFAGGELANSGDVTLKGTENGFTVADGTTAGDVTYDYSGSETQEVVAAAYGTLALTGTGAKKADGDITADSVSNEAEFTVTGSLTADTTLTNEGTVSAGVDLTAETLTNDGTVSVTGNVTADVLTSNDTLSVGGDLTGGTVTASGNVTVGGDMEAETLTNDGTVSVTGSLTATTGVTNSSDLTVGGNFAGGVLSNDGQLNLGGTDNSFTVAEGETAGKVAYDGAAQNVVSGVTYDELALSGGEKTADGDVTAATLTIDGNSTLDVNGALNVTGSLTNDGEIAAGGTVSFGSGITQAGDVTYDGGGDQTIQTGVKYSELTVSGTGTKTANGDVKAENMAVETGVTANVTGNVSVSGDLTNEGTTTVTGNVSVDGALKNTGTASATGNVSAGSTENSSDLTVGGNFAGGALDNTGTMELNGASNNFTVTAGETAGDVAYNGAGNQQIVATEYSNLTIGGSGTKSADGAVSAATTTVGSDTVLDVNGDFAGGTLTNDGQLNLGGANNSFTVADGGTAGKAAYDGADQNVVGTTYTELALSGDNSTKTVAAGETVTVTVMDGFSAENVTLKSDTDGTKFNLTLNDTGSYGNTSTGIAGTTFRDAAVKNTSSKEDPYLYVASTNKAVDSTGIRVSVDNVAINSITYGDAMSSIVVTLDGTEAGTVGELGWTWFAKDSADDVTDSIENATTGTVYVLESTDPNLYCKVGLTVVIDKLQITVKADSFIINEGEAVPELTYTYTPALVGTDKFTGKLACSADGTTAGTYAITQGTLKLSENYELVFTAGVLEVTSSGGPLNESSEPTGVNPNQTSQGVAAVSGIVDMPAGQQTKDLLAVRGMTTLEYQNSRSAGFILATEQAMTGADAFRRDAGIPAGGFSFALDHDDKSFAFFQVAGDTYEFDYRADLSVPGMRDGEFSMEEALGNVYDNAAHGFVSYHDDLLKRKSAGLPVISLSAILSGDSAELYHHEAAEETVADNAESELELAGLEEIVSAVRSGMFRSEFDEAMDELLASTEAGS